MTSMESSTRAVKISELIAQPFHEIWKMARKNLYTEFDETGGRGSTKSSFISLFIVYSMMKDRQQGEITHAVILRAIGKDLRESVLAQIGWAIDKLGVNAYWKRSLSPMKWTYMPYERQPQEIKFRGCDDPTKVKSIKFEYGYAKYLWFEEKDQFKSLSDINSIKLSIARKNDDGAENPFIMFSSYNPPKNPSHWINIDAKRKKPYRHQHHTDYTQVPQEWHTKAFLEEAETMKQINVDEYNHVFLGLVTGLSGLCYPMFDINKHVINLEDSLAVGGGLKILTQFERISKIVCGCDGGTVNDATTLSPMCLTTAGRIILLPTCYFDPLATGHVALSPSKQAKVLENWLWCWTMYLFGISCDEMTTIVVDSACQQLVQEFNDITRYSAMKVPSKDILRDMGRHQNVLSVPNMFLHINAGYIDPLSITFDQYTGRISYTKWDDNDMYIQEVVALCVDEKTGKPIDANNHTIDGLNYGLNVATQIV